MGSFLNILLLLSPTIIYYTAKKSPIATNYNLRKDFKLKGVNTSVLPTEVLRKFDDIDEKKILEQQFSPLIIEFINVIKKNIPSSDLILFFNNFNTLSTSIKEFKLSNIFNNEHVKAQYEPLKNTIELSKDNYELTIDHELFHVSTTFIDPKTNIIFCGFQQININNSKQQIGEGLNEGYTQYLTQKYFNSKSKAYSYEKRIAEIVEMIVGNKKMQSLYFNANLIGLIKILKQYNSEENIYNFLTTLDFLNKHLADKYLIPSSNEILVSSLKYINSFLIETYINKIILEYPKEKIDMKELVENVIPLLGKLPSKMKNNNKEIIINDDSFFVSVIDNVISKYNMSDDRKTISK